MRVTILLTATIHLLKERTYTQGLGEWLETAKKRMIFSKFKVYNDHRLNTDWEEIG